MHIVIIGLPGSGKTTLLQEYCTQYIVYDDCVGSFFTSDLCDNLFAGKSLCIADPRLCNPEIFNKFIGKYYTPSNTKLILFENDPEQCLQNVIARENNRNIIHWKNTINRLTTMYSFDTYKEWNSEAIKVFKR
jgi:GTPase SAR1 family protein